MLRKHEYRPKRISVEGADVLLVRSDELNKLLPRAVSNPEPNKLRRIAVKQAALLEIRVLGDDGEPVDACMLPNVFVGFSK